jgi:hypothetical protein
MSRAKRSLPLRALLLLCALLSAAALLHADEFWKNKPRSEWTLKQTLKLLEDSPWARQEPLVVPMAESGANLVYDNFGNRCNRDSLDTNGNCTASRVRSSGGPLRNQSGANSTDEPVIYLVRWESSAPIEDAFARLSELGEKATAQYLSAPPRLPADRYVVTMKAFERGAPVGQRPGPMPAETFGSIENDESGPRGRLLIGSLVVPASETERSGIGAAEAVYFFFPRTVDGAPVIPEDRGSHVTFEFRGERFFLRTRFSISPATIR